MSKKKKRTSPSQRAAFTLRTEQHMVCWGHKKKDEGNSRRSFFSLLAAHDSGYCTRGDNTQKIHVGNSNLLDRRVQISFPD
jgi:hypothetical protein